MGESKPLSLCVLTQTTMRNLGTDGVRDVFDYRDSDIILVENDRERNQVSEATNGDIFTLQKIRRGNDIFTASTNESQVNLVIATGSNQLKKLTTLEKEGAVDTDAATFIISGVLDVEIDLVNLETTLVGKDDYEENLPDADENVYTHLTVNSPPDYRSNWEEGFTVKGINPDAADTERDSTPEVAFFKLFSDGVVDSQTIQADQFGLQALDQVGPKRLRKLNGGGVIAIEDVLQCGVRSLSEINGIGEKTAEKIYYSAKAQIEQSPIRLTDEPLPDNPLYIDIETDGLTPTMVWLIGVYDPLSDRYIAFLETDPDQKGAAITHFMDWFSANTSNRTLVAYNGMKFDFPVVADHINQHCPKYITEWERAHKFDMFWWATKQDNAIFPGQTNKLEDVAHSLGWEGPDIEITGEVVGERFSRWMKNPCSETELEWDRYEKYCESDVRALHHILEEVRSAEIAQGKQEMVENKTAKETKQGRLGDY